MTRISHSPETLPDSLLRAPAVAALLDVSPSMIYALADESDELLDPVRTDLNNATAWDISWPIQHNCRSLLAMVSETAPLFIPRRTSTRTLRTGEFQLKITHSLLHGALA